MLKHMTQDINSSDMRMVLMQSGIDYLTINYAFHA